MRLRTTPKFRKSPEFTVGNSGRKREQRKMTMMTVTVVTDV